MNLTTQDEQVACFANAARHLRRGGRFVLEVGVPQLHRLPPGNSGLLYIVTPDLVSFDEYVDRTHAQLSRSRYLVRQEVRTFREFSLPFRYVWPAELDLMARLAGMTLEHRWADWTRSTFTSESPSHVSVYRRIDG